MIRMLLALSIFAIVTNGCGGGDDDNIQVNPAVPKGDRILAVDITESENRDFNSDFAVAQSAGMESTSLFLNWSEIEPSSGNYNNHWLAIANGYYPPLETPINLCIAPINTNQLEVPSDLVGLNFDDPVMISRFKALLDFVFEEIPDITLTSLAIGNEIDGYLQSDAEWAQYQAFFEAVSAYARTKRDNLKVGAKAMFDGITSHAAFHLADLNDLSDVVMVTYYPMNTDFTVKDSMVVHDDFDALVSLYPGKPIYLLELGYPAGAGCNSSVTQQRDFIRAVFAAWDANRDAIKLIAFTWLHDLSAASVQDLVEYYEIDNPGFHEYLLTLGLRNYAGAGLDKPAFTALKAEAADRGW